MFTQTTPIITQIILITVPAALTGTAVIIFALIVTMINILELGRNNVPLENLTAHAGTVPAKSKLCRIAFR